MKNLKKLFALTLALALVFALSACGKQDAAAPAATEETKTTTLTVGASITPHAEILAVAGELLAAQGIELNIVEYNDYVLPNTATESGELDANFFQHLPYLNDFNAANGTHLVSVGIIHYEPFGIYAGKTASLDALPDGAVIAVPNDGSNEARALILLAREGLITLKEGSGYDATVLDIVENPHNYDIQEIEAAQIPRSLPDVDIGVINGNYALEAGLSIADAIASEDADSDAAQTYANILVVKEGRETDPAILALLDALRSEEVRSFIEEKYAGTVVALF